MCSVKVTFIAQPDGSQQTIVRTINNSGSGDNTGAAANLAALRTHIADVQMELNTALTVLVDKEKAANANSALKRPGPGADEDEDAEDDDEDDENGHMQPPEKIRKT